SRKKAKAAAPAKAAVAALAPRRRGRPAKVAAPVAPALDPVAANYLSNAIGTAIAELERLRRLYKR
ncbi:MAG: hypothetical protein ABSE73_25005, partial [Planctomycetota bacterium]